MKGFVYYEFEPLRAQFLADSHMVFPLTGLAIIVYVLCEINRAAKILGACWIAIGVVYYLVLTFLSKKPVALEV